MLRVSGLRCERDQRVLFDDLSFQLEAGEIVQIMGANGAGKTTLLRILCGLYGEFDGEISWQLARHPLFLSHKPGVKDALSTAENLAWLCQLHQTTVSREQISEVLARVRLGGYENVLCGKLSEGQRKRVNLARFYLLQSPVWLLDEPFSAIDTEGVALFEALMESHLQSAGAIMFTSHQAVSVGVDVRSLKLSGAG